MWVVVGGGGDSLKLQHLVLSWVGLETTCICSEWVSLLKQTLWPQWPGCDRIRFVLI